MGAGLQKACRLAAGENLEIVSPGIDAPRLPAPDQQKRCRDGKSAQHSQITLRLQILSQQVLSVVFSDA